MWPDSASKWWPTPVRKRKSSLRTIDLPLGELDKSVAVFCDRALLGAYTQNEHRVSATLVRQAAALNRGDGPKAAKPAKPARKA